MGNVVVRSSRKRWSGSPLKRNRRWSGCWGKSPIVTALANGPVTARDSLELQGKARIVGDVAYRTLEMHVGAFVQGRLDPVEAEPGTALLQAKARDGGTI